MNIYLYHSGSLSLVVTFTLWQSLSLAGNMTVCASISISIIYTYRAGSLFLCDAFSMAVFSSLSDSLSRRHYVCSAISPSEICICYHIFTLRWPSLCISLFLSLWQCLSRWLYVCATIIHSLKNISLSQYIYVIIYIA